MAENERPEEPREENIENTESQPTRLTEYPRDGCCKLTGRFVAMYWRSLVVVLWPLVCLPVFVLPGQNTPKFRCAYVLLVMAIYWVTEALPLPITSMIPMFAFPMLSILPTETTTMQYFKETNVMFFGGLMIALSIEYCQLHTRIALKVMLLIGTSHRRLTLGLFLVTMFVSMWVSNTAATAMMAPVVRAILEQLESQRLLKVFLPTEREKEREAERRRLNENRAEEDEPIEPPAPDKEDDEMKRPGRTTLCYFLGIAYVSSIGGTGAIVGTGTNLTFKGLFESRFPDAPEIDFGKWILFNTPPMLINTLVTWAWLNWLFLGLFRKGGMDPEVRRQLDEGKEENRKIQAISEDVIRQQQDEQGSLTWHETMVGLLFLLAVGLWIFRKPGFVIGWAERLTDLRVGDGTAAILITTIMFMIPAKLEFLRMCSRDPTRRPKGPSQGLLTWNVIHQKMPWGLLFLLGGGFAVAKGSEESGLSKALGQSLKVLEVLPPIVLLFVTCLIATNLTEFASNVAIANIILPVLAEMAVVIKVNPMLLMYPVALTCSYSFMMPVGTPPNALVAGMININTLDMIIGGIGPTLITLITTVFFFPTYGNLVYDFTGFPAWAEDAPANATETYLFH